MQITNHARGLEIQRPVLLPVINTLKQSGKIYNTCNVTNICILPQGLPFFLMIIIINIDYL